jgi:redox-sensitive bicupin YhaK (pirin superfamily)
VILPGDGQRMSAGRGIRHSEANPSVDEAVHLLQIWILPDKQGHQPGYEQKSFPEDEKRGKFRLIASNDGADGSVRINQDAKLFVTLLAPGEEVTQSLAQKRHAWLQIAKGEVELNGQKLQQGDGVAISDEKRLTVKATDDAEVLLFDLA